MIALAQQTNILLFLSGNESRIIYQNFTVFRFLSARTPRMANFSGSDFV